MSPFCIITCSSFKPFKTAAHDHLNDIVADLIRQTRTKYHLVCKMGLKRDAEIRCDKMAECTINNDNKSFWKQPKLLIHL